MNNPHFRLLFDIYHEQVQIGNVTRTLTEAAPHVAVFHVADNPGRNDPGTGEMNYANIYKAIQKTGYAGYVCMEYLPLADPVESLMKSVDEMKSERHLVRIFAGHDHCDGYVTDLRLQHPLRFSSLRDTGFEIVHSPEAHDSRMGRS